MCYKPLKMFSLYSNDKMAKAEINTLLTELKKKNWMSGMLSSDHWIKRIHPVVNAYYIIQECTHLLFTLHRCYNYLQSYGN